MDWSKLENIIFVAVSAVIALFLFITVFFVISKGKHKTRAIDILLRIVSVLTLIASAVLFVAAVFAELDGDYKIVISHDEPLLATLMLGTTAIELPAPQLFVTLATTTGHEIVIGLFIIALVALISDCMLAKRKHGGAKVKPEKKSAETKSSDKSAEALKRAAELEKIKRLGDAAVKKTNSAASAQAAAPEPQPSDKPDVAAPAEPSAADEPDWLKAATDDGDWRASEKSDNAEFVGLSGIEDADPDFDTFDDVPDPAAEKPWYEDGAERSDAVDTAAPPTDEFGEFDAFDAFDEFEQTADPDIPNDTDLSDADALERNDEYDVEDGAGSDPTDEYDADNAGGAFDPTDEYDAQAYDSEDRDGLEGIAEEEPYSDDAVDEAGEPEDDAEAAWTDIDDQAVPNTAGDAIEPDRNIYIPTMRTIERAQKPPARREPTTDRRTPSAAKNSAPKKSAPAAKSKSGGKKSPDPKALPVTRRYVILDRTSAVNIFSDYLKARDKADKDKLESSISTIIIK